VACVIAVGIMGLSAQAQELAGTWQGTMHASKEQRIVVKITKADSGWQGVYYNLDSNSPIEGLVTKQMNLQGGELRFSIATMDGNYDGKLSDDEATIAGMMTLNGKSSPLNLARATGDAVWEIPKANKMMAKDADPDWEVVTIHQRSFDDPRTGEGFRMKGREFIFENKTAEMMLLLAYGVHKNQVLGAPHWLATERWDVQGVLDVPGTPNLKQMQNLTRQLLEERFGLRVHWENKELAVYSMTVAKGGAKLAKSAGDPNGLPDGSENENGGQVWMRMTNESISDLAMELTYYLDRPVVDQTGMSGRYDFQLKWTNDDSRVPTDGTAAPLVFTAIQEQLGLKLEPVREPTRVLVVDALERPTAN